MSEYCKALNQLNEAHDELDRQLEKLQDSIDLIEVEERRLHGELYAKRMKELRINRMKSDVAHINYAYEELHIRNNYMKNKKEK